MKNLLHLTMVLFMFGFLNPIIAQNPVNWEFKTEKIDDSTAYLVIEATITEGWKIYGYVPHLEPAEDDMPTITVGEKNYADKCDPNLGTVCLEFNFDEMSAAMLLGNILASKESISKYDSIFQGQLSFFKGTVQFRQKFRYTPNQSLKGYVYFMCFYKEEKCMPPRQVDFSVGFP
jgi:hypothetical protein